MGIDIKEKLLKIEKEVCKMCTKEKDKCYACDIENKFNSLWQSYILMRTQLELDKDEKL